MTLDAAGLTEAQEIAAWLDEKPTLARVVGAQRRFDALREREPGAFATRRMLVVRNFTLEPIEPLLRVAAYRAGLHMTVAYSGYEPAAAETFDQLGELDPDVVVVAMRLEEMAPALTTDFLQTDRGVAQELADHVLDQTVALVRGLRDRAGAAVLVHNFVMPVAPAAGLADTQDASGQLNLVRALNVELAARIGAIDGAYVLDADHVLSQLGLAQVGDERGARSAGAPYSQAALRALADAQVRHVRALCGPAAKLVVVDCDNTLWGGVVGEDGLAGIVLGETGAGRRHRDLQQSLLDLRHRGIVLAISSKNEEADVLDVLRSHPDCLLSEGDFAAMRVNWDDKATSVESIAAELNLGLDHVVFVDDNPVECDWVAARLPAVEVVRWEGQRLDDLGLFDSLLLTDEDRARTEMYRAESRRREAREEMTVDDYLRSLDMVAVLGLTGPERLPRVAQLIQKTNQFNLTTRRHDLAAVDAMLADPDTRVVWMELRDRFGSNGVVGCGIVRRAGDEAVVDTLLMSCRVIGRGAENVLVNRLAALARELGATTLVGEYIASRRNAQVAELFGRLGFEPAPEGPEGPRWRWALDDGLPAVPEWFRIIDSEEGDA